MTAAARQSAFEPLDFFVLRVPLLSVDELLGWGAGLESPGASETTLDAALVRDDARLTKRLRAIVARPEVREALFLASPDLFDRLRLWEHDRCGKEDAARVTRALIRYFARMASRPTPFGLFAGVGVGSIGGDTRLVVGPRTARRRRVRLDMGYLERLTVHLQQDPAVRAGLLYQANTSIAQNAARLHYVETHHQTGGRAYTLVSVDASSEVAAVLRRAATPTPLADLAAVLVSDEVSDEEADTFVGEMVEAQLLVPDLEPAVTGSRSLDDLICRLRALDAGTASVLSDVVAELHHLEAEPLGVDPDGYARVRELLARLPGSVDAPQHVLQVDTVLAVDAVLGPAVVEEFTRATECLFRIGGAESRPLSGFLRSFVERYERREVPLLEALDEEIGIGLPSEAPDPGVERAHAAQQSAIMRLIVGALARGEAEIALTDADVDSLAYGGPEMDLPPGFAMMAALAAVNTEALRAGDFRVVFDAAMGPSGAVLFGRFCHNDPALASAVTRQLAAEEAADPSVIHAEVVHLPEGRTGNILSRPVLRAYEIPFLGRSGAAADRQIALDDLIVSVRGGRVVLRSQRLGCAVVPHFTTAHNADLPTALPVYRFLARFERQHTRYAIGWPWGALAELPFLPRVTYGRTVLSRAQWVFTAQDLAPVVQSRGAARLRAVRTWRERTRLPRLVQLRDGDNLLFVDFDNPISVEVLFDLVKNRPSTTLVELLPTPHEAGVTGIEGRFVHELIVPFVRRRRAAMSSPLGDRGTRAVTAIRPGPRQFAPGSEWLYAKLYTGLGVADRVLREVVAPVVHHAIRSGAAERWFFLRYADPHPHIRLRFFGRPNELTRDVLPALTEAATPFLQDGRIWRIQLDTYEREVERYGGSAGVELAECLFSADSAAALALVLEYGGAENMERRALITMAGIDHLLADFGLSPAERIALLSISAPDTPELHREWGVAYRHTRGAIERALDATVADPALGAGLAVLRRRSSELAPITLAIRDGLSSGTIEGPADPLLLSFTHMFVNRVQKQNQTAAERQYYDFVRRFHAGRLARNGEQGVTRRGRDAAAPR